MLNIFSSNTAERPYTDSYLIFFFLSLLLFFLFFSVVKKLWYLIYFRKKYFIFPQLHIKTITNIAMIIAMNTALIFTITWLSGGIFGAVFQIYPGTRMFIENTLIKIGGIMFGPVIGIFIGATTDLLTVILASSVLNYGYWLCAVLNGFSGGLIHLLMNMKGSKKVKSSSTCVFLMLLSLYFLWSLLSNNFPAASSKLNVLAWEISIEKIWVFVFICLIGSIVIIQIICSVVSNFLIINEKFKENKIVVFYSKSNVFLQILAVNFLSYIVLDIISLPLFDIKLSTVPYEQFLIMRVFLTIPMLFISSVIIWNIYKLHKKIKPIETKEQALEFIEKKPQVKAESIEITKLSH